MSRLAVLAILAILLTCLSMQTRARGSACWYRQGEILLAKHHDCLKHQGKHAPRVNSMLLQQLPFEGRYATIFSKKYGWMYVNRAGVVVIDHVMDMDNGADYIANGFVRFTQNGKCGYASVGNDREIPPKYDGCLPFSGAKAKVCSGCRVVTTGEHSFYKGGHSFCIDAEGRHVGCEPSQSSERAR